MEADETLMAAVAAGDGAALAELCRRWEHPLFRLLARQTGGRDVDDLYQETWLRVVRHAARFDRSRRFSTWLFQIAVNLCRDWHRKPPPEPHVAVDEPAVVVDGSVAIDAERLLAALPQPQRAAVLLRYYHDLPEDEVAEILGCPRGTVKSRLHHAMATLKRLAGVDE